MPRLDIKVHILRAWRHRNESDRIHYVSVENGRQRHLYVDSGNPLYDFLEASLKAKGYTGPQVVTQIG